MYKNQYSIKKRLFALFLGIILIFFGLIFRLFYLTVISSTKMNSIAFEQWTRDLPITAKRGEITDRNGVVLATNVTSYSVYVRSRQIENAEIVASYISEKLNINKDNLKKKFENTSISEQVIARQVESEIAMDIISQEFAGIFLSIDNTRYYRYDNLLSQVLGYVSIDNKGQSGIEQYYEKYLQGINGQTYVQSDILGFEIDGTDRGYIEALDGQNVQLTIDYRVQAITENVLSQIMVSHHPKEARAIVMDVQTGEILSMANFPSFDLNNPPRDNLAQLNELSRNSLVVDIYEPGSTFKIFTSAINLEEYYKGNSSCYSPDYVFTNSSRYRVVDGQKIKCWNGHLNGKHSHQTLQEALNNSCNPIFVDLALAIGKDKFYSYLDKFKLSEKTGIDFPGEANSMFVSLESLKNCDLARIGFGQTVAVTPMQLLASSSAIINGGIYYTPTLLKQITTKEGQTVVRNYPQGERIISQKTSKQMASMLEKVVSEGSGKQCYIEGAKVGGKTGTAQKYENGRIAEGKYISSFVGYYPADNPKYSCIVIVDEPVGQHYGSIVAAPYAKMIFEQMIQLKL